MGRAAQSILPLFLLLAGCPDSQPSRPDAAAPDQGLTLTEAGLARCSVYDAYCTPADPCGLNPRCSAAGVCLTSGARDCDDGIACTQDRCVHGGCEHVVADGTCLIDEVCYKKGATQGCGRCRPEVSQVSWAPLDGTSCDDRNPCTKGDGCKQGICVGQAYTCTDSLSCTTDSCDGLGGCNSFLDPSYCLIEKKCYRDGEVDPSGCKICDVTVSQSSWQPRANVCAIDGTCYPAGAKDATGCFTCEPLHAPQAWTPLPGLCLISQVCLQKGSMHPSGCATCDPALDTSGWSPVAGAAVTVHDFSQGLSGYTATKPMGKVGWQLGTARYRSPPASLYYGDPATASYDSGAANSGTVVSPEVAIPANLKSHLSFQLYMDTETTSAYDLLTVRVQQQVLWSKASHMQQGDYGTWKAVHVDLSAYAGQTVQVVFHFDTKDELNNQSEGIYIDDVTLLTGCP